MDNYDVIIIGGGPAGLTAGIYIARSRLKVLLLEQSVIGGQLSMANWIENYPGFPEGIGGFELVDNMKKQAERYGVEFVYEKVKQVAAMKQQGTPSSLKVITEDKQYGCMAVINASGASAKKLGVPGEKEFTGKGVSYCATCDGAFFKDKDIVVVGEGEIAVEETLFLTKFGRKVTVVHRRDQLKVSGIMLERVRKNEKISFQWNSAVTEIKGDTKVRAIRVMDLMEKTEKDIACDGVFIFAGFVSSMPSTDYLRGMVELDEKGYIITNNDMNTSKEGIFACGDCRKKVSYQVVTACGDGAMAAHSARKYIEKMKG